MKMDKAPEGEWIEENSWKYGFILRYPLDKTDVTGIQYEPWHIRYKFLKMRQLKLKYQRMNNMKYLVII